MGEGAVESIWKRITQIGIDLIDLINLIFNEARNTKFEVPNKL